MTDREARKELERIVEEEYPLIASEYIDKEIMLETAREIEYELKEWRGAGFPYARLHKDYMSILATQYMTTDSFDLFYEIGEEEVVGFLNRYYRWKLIDSKKQSKELEKNTFELSEKDKKDFEKFCKIRPVPCREPLDTEGYLHMCRIAYDAAPMFVYPDFISDLYVVGSAKFDSCGLEHKYNHRKMKVGDSYPGFMTYHPEEMGFGGPYIRFSWDKDGWIMVFFGREDDYLNHENKDIHRFLAMRRAGYPVVYEKCGE